MRTWHWLLVGAGAYFFTDGFKQIPFFGGKDDNDAVGSRNETTPKLVKEAVGGVPFLGDLAEITGGVLDESGAIYGPTGPFVPEWMQRDKDTPLWRDLTSGGGFNPPSYGLPWQYQGPYFEVT